MEIEFGDIAENVLMTFRQLAGIERDFTYDIPRADFRLVPDSHFYVVIFACIFNDGKEHHHLGGNDMYRYLLTGNDAKMHRFRNERLFRAVRGAFGLEKLAFVIYPPQAVRLPTVSQFSWEPERFRADHWLGKILAAS
jgi:hypothetical protein